MAIPPDPIEEVLPNAALVIDAEVKDVQNGPAVPKVSAPPGWTDVPQKVGSQVVTLVIKRVLKGETTAKEITVEKPVGAYALKPGNKGPFLLDASRPRPVILGRYGPDSYSFQKIETALKE